MLERSSGGKICLPMIRRIVALLLVLFIAVGDAEGALTSACDVGAEMAERAAKSAVDVAPDDSQRPESLPSRDDCHCAHAHLQTVVAAARTERPHALAVVAAIAAVDRVPSSADRARLLRPPRI